MHWVIRTIGGVFLVGLAVACAPLIQAGRVGELVPLLPFVISIVAALVLTERSFDNLSDSGQRRPMHVLMRGGLARREEFTDVGWRYREWSYRVGLAGFVISAALLLF